jgi:predicted site-specific integrase-resolvase
MDMGDSTQTTTDSGLVPRIGRSISLDHAGELLGMSRRTLYHRIREGLLQTIRTPNGSQRVLIESVIELLRYQRDELMRKHAARVPRRDL